MSTLSQLIGQIESGNNPNAPLTDYEGNVSVNAQYQQSSGWQAIFGSGASGIDNEASQFLAANPNATLGDFYSAYNHGLGSGGTAFSTVLPYSQYSSLFPTQANNFSNNATAAGYSPNTPLSSLVGGSNTATSSNDPLGSSLTIDPNGASEFGNATPALGNDQGTPSLGGGASTSALPTGSAGSPLPGQQNTGEASIAGQAVQSGLGTAGKAVQTGAQNAAAAVAGTLASTINSIEQYTSSAFVIAALVVVGVIFVAYGLGLFKARDVIPAL